MAKANYLVSGLPGTGKTSVCLELQTRGYSAVDADRAIAFQVSDGWLWDGEKLEKALNNSSGELVFVCGSASNRDEFITRFQKVFILHVDDQTLKQRLLSRTNNNFGKDPAILARQIINNQGVKDYSVKRGRTVIDASQPIDKVVDEIISSIQSPTP